MEKFFKNLKRAFLQRRYIVGKIVSRFIAKDVKREILVTSLEKLDEGIITGKVRTRNVLYEAKRITDSPEFGPEQEFHVSDLWKWGGTSDGRSIIDHINTYRKVAKQFYPDQIMLPWELRESASESWFRIYSLPEGKRYPEDDHEKEIVLHRHCNVSNAVLGIEDFILVSWVANRIPEFPMSARFTIKCDEEEYQVNLAGVKVWDFDSHREMIHKIANDEYAEMIFMNARNGNIYAPYDGGADLFIPDVTRYKVMREQFQNWSSSLESGL